MKIIVALIPIFIVAAFLESFVTRHTEMPMFMSVSILAASGIFMIWYFVWYPIRVYRMGYRLDMDSKLIKPAAA